MNLSLLSKYRTELMGVAVIMVILCHIACDVPGMNSILRKILNYGNAGVDIFLFASGYGMYFSLSAGNSTIGQWYRRRFTRVLIPYFLIAIPYWIFATVRDGGSVASFLFNFSTLSFWTNHVGAWYMAMLLPLYLGTPLLYRLLSGRHRYVCAALLIVLSAAFCMLDFKSAPGSAVLANIQFTTGRFPAFVAGMLAGPAIKSGSGQVGWIVFALLAAAFIPVKLFCTPTLVFPVLGIAFALLFVAVIEAIGCVPMNALLNKLGKMSLEAYLCNIFLRYALLPYEINAVLIAVLAIIIAFAFNSLSVYLISRSKI